MKKLAVVILNWNGIDLLRKFLPTAVRYTISEDTDLIVADNGSTDDSVNWIRANCPEVKVLSFNDNLGFAAGYNKAISELEYEFVLLLNSDVEVTDGWTIPLLSFMLSNKDVGACQPKIKSYYDKSKFEYAGAAGGFLDKFGYPYCRGRLFNAIEEDCGQYDGAPYDVCWASGAALMVRRDVYLQAGGLDARFFAHMEEIDLCCRIHALSKRVCAVSDSCVYHVGGASLPQGNPKKTYLNFRNNLLLLHKNLPIAIGRKRLFVRRLMDTLAFGMFLVKGDVANAKAVLRAHNDFRKMKKFYVNLPIHDYMSALPGATRNIVVDFYLKGKRK
jgi:hypothetical protein